MQLILTGRPEPEQPPAGKKASSALVEKILQELIDGNPGVDSTVVIVSKHSGVESIAEKPLTAEELWDEEDTKFFQPYFDRLSDRKS